MDEVQVKIISAEFGKRIIENRFNVLGRMEVVPKLTAKISVPNIRTQK